MKFVPRLLIKDKDSCLAVCMDLHAKVRNVSGFLPKVVLTSDRWVCGYNPKTKQQLSMWMSPYD